MEPCCRLTPTGMCAKNLQRTNISIECKKIYLNKYTRMSPSCQDTPKQPHPSKPDSYSCLLFFKLYFCICIVGSIDLLYCKKGNRRFPNPTMLKTLLEGVSKRKAPAHFAAPSGSLLCHCGPACIALTRSRVWHQG